MISAVPEALVSTVPDETVPYETVPSSAVPASSAEVSSSPGFGSLAAFGAFVALAGSGIALLLRPKRCPRCREKMTLMDESEDDAHLTQTERLEEQIGSVDHKIWVCPACGEQTKGRWNRPFSGYKSCPECQARTLSSSSTTLRHATENHGGIVLIDESCVHCSYRNSYERSTPRLQRRNYRSSSSSSFGSSSSRSSSSSGFSGGHSSGRGSSGKW